MKRIVAIALLALAAPLIGGAGSSAAPRPGDELLATVTVPFDSPALFPVDVAWIANATYTFEVSGDAQIDYGDGKVFRTDAFYCHDSPFPDSRCDGSFHKPNLVSRGWATLGFPAPGYMVTHGYSIVRQYPAGGAKLELQSEMGPKGNCRQPGYTCTGGHEIKVYGPPSPGEPPSPGGGETKTVTAPAPGQSTTVTSPTLSGTASKVNVTVGASAGNLNDTTIVGEGERSYATASGEAVAACWLIGPDAVNLNLLDPPVRRTVLDQFQQLLRNPRPDPVRMLKLCIRVAKALDGLSEPPSFRAFAAADGCRAQRLGITMKIRKRKVVSAKPVTSQRVPSKGVRYRCATGAGGAVTLTVDGRSKGGLRKKLGKTLKLGIVRGRGAPASGGQLTFGFGG